jgi:hypothetical protein
MLITKRSIVMRKTPKVVHVVGGGTRHYIDGSHLYLGSKADGKTAETIARLCREHDTSMEVVLTLTSMADRNSTYDTVDDVAKLAHSLVADTRTKIVFWTPSVLDFIPLLKHSGATTKRLTTRTPHGAPLQHEVSLVPSLKIVELFRKGEHGRKDIFLVACKQTAGASEAEQYRQGLLLMKRSGANLVLANDAITRLNMIIVPEEATYAVSTDREHVLRELVEMAYLRSHLTFTRSTVVAGEPVPWSSPLVPSVLRTVVNHCVDAGAYKVVNGATAGHFAVKLSETEFLTSRRKTDFNKLAEVGMVRVRTDGPDTVIAYGSQPSVGGQSQRIVFAEHPGMDCIVHFHCPMRPGAPIPVVSQREYECGSHQCGENTSRGLATFGNLSAVFLDNHGPNIVFKSDIDPAEVIAFISQHFDLSRKTGGYPIESTES